MLLFTAVLFVPFLIVGVPGGHPDQDHHLRLIRTFDQGLREGNAYPSFSAEGNMGLGSYDVRVYPPLFHFISAALVAASGQWNVGLYLTFAFFAGLGMFGVFKLAEDYGYSKLSCIAAAVIFALAPYWLNHAYNSFFYGEFAAMGILPFCFLFTRRVCRSTEVRNVIGLAVSGTALLLSNLPQAAIGSMAIGVYVLLQIDRTRIFKQAVGLGISLLISGMLGAFYIVRLIFESAWFKIAQPNTDPAYDFRSNFVLSGESGWFAAIILGISFAALVIGMISAGTRAGSPASLAIRPIVVVLFFAAFLMLPVSSPIWTTFETLQRVQFPWRFLSIVSLCVSLLFAFFLETVRTSDPLTRRPRSMILGGLMLILATFSVKQIVLAANYLPPAQFESKMAGIGSTVGLEHWEPVWLDHSLFASAGPPFNYRSGITINRPSPDLLNIRVENPDVDPVELPVVFYPIWSARSDGAQIAVRPGEKGTLSVQTLKGHADIELRFAEPAYVLIANALSLISFAAAVVIILLSLLGVDLWKRRK